MLHQQLLNQQPQSQAKLNAVFNSLPPDIIATLDGMAYGIATKENLDTNDVQSKMVNNINRLSQKDAEYLVANMAILIDKSVQQNETIDDTNTQREFISFLIKLYY